MIIKLNFQSEIPIYLQLRSQIIKGIANGELKPGEALPSVRQFSSDLGINMHTVNKTYTLLKQDGFLLIHRQKGVVINPDGMPTITEDFMKKVQEDAIPLITEAYCRGMKLEEFNKFVKEVYDQLEAERGNVK